MAPKTTKILLLAGIATIAISTPVFAYNGLGLRGVQAAPQGYSVQYAGGTYVAPQAQGYYQQQQYFADPNVSSAYQVPQPIYNVAPVQVASYAPSGLRIPAGNYTGSLGLRGSSQAFGREFNVGGTTVTTNVKHSKRMLNWQENTTGKTLTLLAIRDDQPLPDAKLNALSELTKALVVKRGNIDAADVAAFVQHGYSETQILDVILALSAKTISNSANHIVQAPVDDVFAGRIWTAK